VKRTSGAAACAALTVLAGLLSAQATSPEKFFGFQPGSDRKIVRWDRIVEYYKVIEKESGGKIKVVEMGPSTMGNPFLLVVVTAPANMAKLERLREINLTISDPRGRAESDIRKLVAEGRAVVCQTMSLHASEIGGTQMAPELAWDLVTRGDEETRRILDNVVFLLIPSFNPDGNIMVADYYNKTLGTEFEGSSLPWLYHKYAGHDNNRDAFQQNLVESRYVGKILFRDWVPQAYIDHHHMGPYGARIYLPPYAEPVRPGADPLVWREMSWYGAHMAYLEEERNLSGVLNMAQYSGWGHFGFHWITPFHNIAGMLTESASARLATPMLIHPEQLRGDTRGLPAYAEQTTFPNPWPGGWWKLRDVVERQKTAAWAALDLAARNRETVLWNAYLKAKRQTERGAAGRPTAYAIPRAQHDSLTAGKLIDKLLGQGVDVRESVRAFSTSQGMSYPAGTWVVPAAQPKLGVIRYLLGRTRYPDNEYTRARDGSPMRPYDMATDTMFEYMGVRVDPLDQAPSGEMKRVTERPALPGRVATQPAAYRLDGRLNDSFLAVNLLLDQGIAVHRAHQDGAGLRAGDFVVEGARGAIEKTAARSGVDFVAASAGGAQPLKRLRIAMYQRYRGGNIDEGWTRLLLEQYAFPYKSVMDAELKKGGLNSRYDVLILPEDSTSALTGDRPADAATRSREEEFPPEYRSGMGKEGVQALVDFVRGGGRLLALGGSGTFAIEKLGLAVRSTTAGRGTREFWCPGSTLRVGYDTSHPLAWGMPAEGLGLWNGGSSAYEVAPGSRNEDYETPVRFAARDLLESGWLIGESLLASRPAVVTARVGRGQVVLYGIRVQHRAQTDGTYKLLFNALVE
jgi:hypothetical protein